MVHDVKNNGYEHATAMYYKIATIPTQEQIDTFTNTLHGKIAFVVQVRGKEDVLHTQFREDLRGVIF